MPKYDREEKAKIKFRFVEFDMEGGSAALHESLRAIAGAINRGAKPAALPMTSKPGAQALTAGDAQDPEEAETDDGLTEELPEADQREQNRANGAPKKLRTPQIVDLDLKTAPGLKEYCDKLQPEGDNKRYLAIVAYLRQHRTVREVTMDHVYTCYRHMGWNVPRDVSSPLRGLKKSGWLDKGEAKGAYALNHIGENEIEKMSK